MVFNMITVNCMIRNEPFAPYGLMAVVPYVNEVIITDTGSSSEFLEPLADICYKYPHVKFNQVECPDGHGWQRLANETTNCNEEAGVILANVRRKQQEDSQNNLIWVLDGDEIPTDSLVQYVISRVVPIMNDINNLDCVYLPVIDLADKNTIRQIHSMGRIFKKDKVWLKGDFPHEQHHSKLDNWPLLPGDGKSAEIELKFGHILHLESVLKPHRKTEMRKGPYNFKPPEVLNRFPQWEHLIKSYW